MRLQFLLPSFFAAAIATAQTVSIEPVPDSTDLFTVRTVTEQPSGASTLTVSKPLTGAQVEAEILARYRAISGEIAVYETALVTARKQSGNLMALVAEITGTPIENAFRDALKNLAGQHLLVIDGEKAAIITIDGDGGFFPEKEDGGQVTMRSAKEFVVSGYFEKSRLWGLFREKEDVTFFQEDDRTWRAKSESEIILLKL